MALKLARDGFPTTITPYLLQGTYDLWPPGQLFASSGEATVKFLAPIPVSADLKVCAELYIRSEYICVPKYVRISARASTKYGSHRYA